MSFKNTNNIIKVDMDFDFDLDLVDEDDLLELAPPVVYPTNNKQNIEPGDCPPKGCKNCTCGKADKKNDE